MNKIALFGALITSSLVVHAIPLQYEIGGGSVVSNGTDPGLKIETSVSSSLAGSFFNLDDGESTTLNFFKIWADEGSVQNDDEAQMNISATLNFTTPIADSINTGVTFGASVLWGLYDYGVVQWDAPELITVGDRVFSVALNDTTFSAGSWIDFDLSNDASWVKATITQISSGGTAGASVPDGGSTAILLGIAAVAGSIVRRKLS